MSDSVKLKKRIKCPFFYRGVFISYTEYQLGRHPIMTVEHADIRGLVTACLYRVVDVHKISRLPVNTLTRLSEIKLQDCAIYLRTHLQINPSFLLHLPPKSRFPPTVQSVKSYTSCMVSPTQKQFIIIYRNTQK